MSQTIELKGDILRSLQLTELEILKDVAAFCEENEITYFLTSGTLLGAVRHGGFIPWDDDVDIAMPRKDFERFLALSEKLPQKYVCQATRFNQNYPIGIAKIRKIGTVMKEPDMENLDIEHGIWIDVFPLDKVDNAEALSKRAKKIHLLTTAISFKLGTMAPRKLTTIILCKILLILGIKRLDAIRTKLMMKEENSDARLLTNFVSNLGYKNLLMDKDIFFPGRKIMFEDTLFWAPSDSEQWLRNAYGDYMTPPPPQEQKNRHKIVELHI